jgi:hypothetical protein
MTTKPFDQFNKQLFQELLSPFGQVFPNFAVLGEERAIDIFFVPHPGVIVDADELGYLADMSQQPALLEPFRSALLDEDVHNCMMKLFMVIEGLMLARFGTIDPDLLQLIPTLMKLNSAEYTKLLVDLSREELLQHFN